MKFDKLFVVSPPDGEETPQSGSWLCGLLLLPLRHHGCFKSSIYKRWQSLSLEILLSSSHKSHHQDTNSNLNSTVPAFMPAQPRTTLGSFLPVRGGNYKKLVYLTIVFRTSNQLFASSRQPDFNRCFSTFHHVHCLVISVII